MGKLEQTMRSEITRLARKEIRAICLPVAREVRKLKRTVSQLSRTVKALEKLGSQLSEKHVAELARLEAPPAEVKVARLSAGLIKKLRKRLGITQAELAGLLSVNPTTVAFWEQGRTRPAQDSKSALVALRKLGRREVQRILEEKAPKE